MSNQLIAIFDLDRTLYHDFDRMELHAPKDMAAAALDDSLWDDYHANHDNDGFIGYSRDLALKLQAEGAILYFVTYRGDKHFAATLARLQQEGFNVDSGRLIMRPEGTKPKMPEFRVTQVELALEYAQSELGDDFDYAEPYFLDDNIENCQAVANSGLVATVEHLAWWRKDRWNPQSKQQGDRMFSAVEVRPDDEHSI